MYASSMVRVMLEVEAGRVRSSGKTRPLGGIEPTITEPMKVVGVWSCCAGGCAGSALGTSSLFGCSSRISWTA